MFTEIVNHSFIHPASTISTNKGLDYFLRHESGHAGKKLSRKSQSKEKQDRHLHVKCQNLCTVLECCILLYLIYDFFYAVMERVECFHSRHFFLFIYLCVPVSHESVTLSSAWIIPGSWKPEAGWNSALTHFMCLLCGVFVCLSAELHKYYWPNCGCAYRTGHANHTV